MLGCSWGLGQMVKVIRPLFADTATGSVKGLGSFRMGQHGPELIKAGGGGGKQPERQKRLKQCFAEAKAAHAASPTETVKRQGAFVQIHTTRWAAFWRQWLIDHPECKA